MDATKDSSAAGAHAKRAAGAPIDVNSASWDDVLSLSDELQARIRDAQLAGEDSVTLNQLRYVSRRIQEARGALIGLNESIRAVAGEVRADKIGADRPGLQVGPQHAASSGTACRITTDRPQQMDSSLPECASHREHGHSALMTSETESGGAASHSPAAAKPTARRSPDRAGRAAGTLPPTGPLRASTGRMSGADAAMMTHAHGSRARSRPADEDIAVLDEILALAEARDGGRSLPASSTKQGAAALDPGI